MITTKYFDNFNKENPLSEYPRPQFVRDSYKSLNGRWEFEISKEDIFPTAYSKIILC